jgi:hypothetical protein
MHALTRGQCALCSTINTVSASNGLALSLGTEYQHMTCLFTTNITYKHYATVLMYMYIQGKTICGVTLTHLTPKPKSFNMWNMPLCIYTLYVHLHTCSTCMSINGHSSSIAANVLQAVIVYYKIGRRVKMGIAIDCTYIVVSIQGKYTVRKQYCTDTSLDKVLGNHGTLTQTRVRVGVVLVATGSSHIDS